MVLMVALLGSAATGQDGNSVARGLKARYDAISGTGTVQAAESSVAAVFGSREILDMCISNKWEAVAIAKGLKGKKITNYMTGIVVYLPDNKRWDFIKTVADSLGKAQAVSLMRWHKKMPEDTSYVFSLNDGSETNIVKSYSLDSYSVMKSIQANKLIILTELSVPDLVDWMLLGGYSKFTSHVEWSKNRIKELAAPFVKRALRAEGKSFVTKDGVNPIEIRMKPVVDALNAPKLQGLEAALRGIGVDIPDIERTPAIWDAITEKKNAIFYGDRPANPPLDGGIVLLLGPDGYNAWVKEFNEGK
jgi:hypothetical protein